MINDNFIISVLNCSSEEEGEVNSEELTVYDSSSEKNSSKQKNNLINPALLINSKNKIMKIRILNNYFLHLTNLSFICI